MNNDVIWRVLWKEYRFLRGFWLAVALLALGLQVLGTATTWIAMEDPSYEFLYGIAMGFAAFYALGCGATLFAVEHEMETFAFQQALPASSGRVFVGKFMFAVLSFLVMGGVLCLSAAILAWGYHPAQSSDLMGTLVAGASPSIVLLVWGLFFSLTTRHPINAVVLGAAATLLTVVLISPAVASTIELSTRLHLSHSQIGGVRVATVVIVTAAVFAADVVLGLRWLGVRPPSLARMMGWPVFQRAAGREASSVRQTSFVSLLWQQWRQSQGLFGALALTVVVIGFCAFVSAWGRSAADALEWLFPMSGILAAVAGAMVFAGDQQGKRFRFLAERGVRPNQIWLSRQLVWLVAYGVLFVGLALLLLLASCAGNLFRLGAFEPHQDIAKSVGAPLPAGLGMIVMGFATGQLCSILMRSSIVACFVSLVGTGAIGLWLMLMSLLQVPLIWSAAPIPLVLMWASWRRTRDWLEERATWKARTRTAARLLVPAAAILVAVPTYRVAEIPKVDSGVSPTMLDWKITPEEQETADMYRRALQLCVIPRGTPGPPAEANVNPTEAAIVENSAAAIQLALDASERPECQFFSVADLNDWYTEPAKLYRLGNVLIISARYEQAQGNLEASLQRYLAAARLSVLLRKRAVGPYWGHFLETAVLENLRVWAAHPEQTAELLTDASRQLDRVKRQAEPPVESVKYNYLVGEMLLSGPVDKMTDAGLMGAEETQLTVILCRIAPWEAARANRLIAYVTREELRNWASAEELLKKNRSIKALLASDGRHESAAWQWHENTPLAQLLPMAQQGFGAYPARKQASLQTHRNMTSFVFWAHQRRLRDGKLPEKLSRDDDPHLNDILEGKPILYFGNGLPKDWPLVQELFDQYREYRGLQKLNRSRDWPDFLLPENQNADEPRLTDEEAARPFLWCPTLGRVVIQPDPIVLE